MTENVHVQEQFQDAEQQHSTDVLGMWVFLGSEILFFGGLFLVYTIYRQAYPEAFAEASSHLNLWLATANTAILLSSSLTIAMSELLLRQDRLRSARLAMAATVGLGLVFLAIKGLEYYLEYAEGLVPFLGSFSYSGPDADQVRLFFHVYFSMTGLHALHLAIGVGLIVSMLVLSFRCSDRARLERQLEVSALYWHFVDVIWVVVFPILYLIK
ncbi:MAG: cytochrome c oxidase subunit 3 [Pseudohongiellaceae bacterium]